MEIKRESKSKKIYLIDNGKILLETGTLGAEFIICIYTDKPIIITKELDECLYMNLKPLLEGEYIFANNDLSYKSDNKITWFSDQYCDIEDNDQTDRINRLILEYLDNQIIISTMNPFFKKYGIKRSQNIIAFSPSGNGFYSKNINTGLSFQDDIVIAFYKTLHYEYENPKKKVKKINSL